jgi:hypothetical protein
VKRGTIWHPAKDHLKGTESYGRFVNDPTADVTFSVRFLTEDFDEFLFASGDMKVCTKNLYKYKYVFNIL